MVAVAIADLYGYCKQHCPGMLVRLDRTALAKGDYDRAGVKPGWVGYYVDPALQRSGREYVDADESQWAKLEATGGASLEKILELVCDEVPGRAEEARAAGAPDNAACALARDIKKCAAAAQFVGVRNSSARAIRRDGTPSAPGTAATPSASGSTSPPPSSTALSSRAARRRATGLR